MNLVGRLRHQKKRDEAESRARIAALEKVLAIVAQFHGDCFCDDDYGMEGKCLYCLIKEALTES